MMRTNCIDGDDDNDDFETTDRRQAKQDCITNSINFLLLIYLLILVVLKTYPSLPFLLITCPLSVLSKLSFCLIHSHPLRPTPVNLLLLYVATCPSTEVLRHSNLHIFPRSLLYGHPFLKKPSVFSISFVIFTLLHLITNRRISLYTLTLFFHSFRK